MISMTMYSKRILDENIAPGVSDFTSAEIPDCSDLAPQMKFWIKNFFINSTLRSRFRPPMQAYAYNYLRRAQRAFIEHNLARAVTLEFLAQGGQAPQLYADALFHWETFLGQTWHAFQILATAWDGQVFERMDNSPEQRMNSLYNQMKHVESRIENNQIRPGATVPVWLEEAGLISIDSRLSFVETRNLLTELAKYAEALVDPRTARATLDLQVGGSSATPS